MSKNDRVQKFIRDAMLHALDQLLAKIPLMGSWPRAWLLKHLDRKIVTPISEALSANISDEAFSLALRQAMQMLLEQAQEDGVEPKFQEWLDGAVRQALKKLGEGPLTEELQQQQPKRESNLYQINVKSGENDDDDSGGGHARETAVGAYGKGLKADRSPDKVKEEWDAMREAFREEVAGALLQALENIDMEEFIREIDEELDKRGWPSEEDTRRMLKWFSGFLGLNLDVEKLSAKDMEEKAPPLLEKTLKANLPEFDKKFEEEVVPKLNRYMAEAWSSAKQEAEQALRKIFSVKDNPKPQV